MAMAAAATALPAPRVERHSSLPSTNDEAMRLARSGHAGGIWIVADEQTQGRGRHGRVWHSPKGNLYASLLLIDPAPVARLPELGFVAGIALAHAAEAVLAGAAQVRLKWPNDLVHQGAKLSGLMLEGASLFGAAHACVIGFGVNCASAPEGLPYAAEHLSRLAGRPVAPGEILARLASAMTHWLAVYGAGAGFPIIRAEWLRLAAGLGEEISVRQDGALRKGLFQGLDESGRLVLIADGALTYIDAGDVFLLPQQRLEKTFELLIESKI